MQERTEFCAKPRVMLTRVKVQLSPDGEDEEVRVTVPVKPFTGEIVMVEFACIPALTLTVVTLADTVKSVTSTVTVAE